MKSHRVIEGLAWARPLPARPSVIPGAKRLRGTKALGIRFEKTVSKALGPLAHHGQWFEFWDKNGRGFCQPDIVFSCQGNVYVLEVKLTDIEKASAQLTELYLPVVSMALGTPARGIIVTKYLTRTTPKNLIADCLKSAIAQTQKTIPILHYIGTGPI